MTDPIPPIKGKKMNKWSAVCVDSLKKWEHRRLNKQWKRIAREEFKDEQRTSR